MHPPYFTARKKALIKRLLIVSALSVFSTVSIAEKKMTFTTFQGSGIGLYTKPLLTNAYAQLGIGIEIQEYPSARALKISSKGKADGEVSRLSVIEKKFPTLMRIPTPIGTVNSALFTLNPNLKVKSWEALANYRITVINGYKNSMKRTEGMDRIESTNFKQAIELVQKGRVDIAVLTEIDGLRAIKELGAKNIVMLENFIGVTPLYHYIHQKNAAMFDDISAVISKMQRDGELTAYRDEVIEQLQRH